MPEMNPYELNPEWVGKRVKRRRSELGLSAQELADLAETSRQTIVRIEAGQPTRNATFAKVRRVLRLWPDGLRKIMADDATYVVNRFEGLHWNVSVSKHKYQKHGLDSDDPFHVDDPVERRRLGDLGFQPFFTAIVGVQLPGGLMEQAIMELHQPSWVDQHYGEEYIYCLRGEATITIEGTPHTLKQGDSICFQANCPHQYSPGHPLAKGEEAPQVLIVVAMREEDKRRQWLLSMKDRAEHKRDTFDDDSEID
jgi:DNA-binding XRE family transcriptional regulator/uncharacterized cupin superfamily protein